MIINLSSFPCLIRPETGGWADHVVPYHAPEGTAIEWVKDPYGLGQVYTGPGFRLPFYIISPFTRGGSVFTEHSDHNSQLLFLEEWLAAKGYANVKAESMAPWRRAHMSNLVNAFDFSNPDFSVPNIPTAPTPHTDSNGNWDGSSYCESLYKVQQPPVPYGQQSKNMSGLSEKGFKPVRGALTEGRYISFEANGYALQTEVESSSSKSGASNSTSSLTTGKAVSEHDQRSQLFVIHQLEDGGVQFNISSAVDGSYLTSELTFANGTSNAAAFTIQYLGGGSGYSLQSPNGTYLSIGPSGALSTAGSKPSMGFSVFSVTGFT